MQAAAFLVVLIVVINFSFQPFHTAHREPAWEPAQEQTHEPARGNTSHLHLLVVATGSDLNLCRLLLSAAVLRYPPPVLVDWKGEGKYNAAATHLAKIHGPLRYLESLSEAQDNDLVLLVDGYDIIFQLGPEVLLQRYFAEIKASNARLASSGQRDVYNSILYGPDKMCWPLDFGRPACWAVPEPPISPFAFGPATDTDMQHARPRWLNSGTVLGPASDLRKLFKATEKRIEKTYDKKNNLRNSDQMYLSDVWADQEYARLLHRDGKVKDPMPRMGANAERKHPAVKGKQTEFHVALDYGTELFQTVAGYSRFLGWTTFNHSHHSPVPNPLEAWRLDLPQDILQSPKPLTALGDETTTWRDIPLGFNAVTGSVFPILHFTGDKSFRDSWWPRMWYVPHAKDLLAGSANLTEKQIGSGPIDGIQFLRQGVLDGAGQDTSVKSDLGEKLSWGGLCKSHEDILFSGGSPRG